MSGTWSPASRRKSRVETLRETLEVQDAAGLWTWMVGENGHVRRLDTANWTGWSPTIASMTARLLFRAR
jgi:hypothetical protein